MRSRRILGPGALALAASLAFAASPAAADATQGLANSIPSLVSPAQKPFTAPQPRPDEVDPRPTDSEDPNRNGYSVPEAPESPLCGHHFCVHWVAVGLDAPNLEDDDGDGIPDYVEKVLQVAEHVHRVENEKLGWREPKSDGRRGGGVGKTDIYLSQIGGELFGYATPDQGQASKDNPLPRRLYGYLVLDNDYSAFEFPGTNPVNDLEVTLAHEYDHILQYGYDAYQDTWFAESSAVWMEDQVYNDLNGYLRYVKRWVELWATPLTTNSIKEYGTAVWNTWLTRRYGRSFLRKVWAGAIRSRPGGFSVGAYETAFRHVRGGVTFPSAFTEFAAAVAEWRTGEGFRESYLYPDAPRQGSLPLDGTVLTRLLDHATFELLNVSAPGGRAVVVEARAPRGNSAGLALVGRTGGEKQGDVVSRVDYSRGGGRLAVTLPQPGRFKRITAVVVNADVETDGFSAGRLDWRYLSDRHPFEISGRVVP